MTETDLSEYDIPADLSPARRALWMLVARKLDEHFASVFETLDAASDR